MPCGRTAGDEQAPEQSHGLDQETAESLHAAGVMDKQTMRLDSYATEIEAGRALDRLRDSKEQRGYQHYLPEVLGNAAEGLVWPVGNGKPHRWYW